MPADRPHLFAQPAMRCVGFEAQAGRPGLQYLDYLGRAGPYPGHAAWNASHYLSTRLQQMSEHAGQIGQAVRVTQRRNVR